MKAEVSTVGIIGGGQLGMFLAQACQKIGLITHIYSDTDDAPAKKYANKIIYGSFNDHKKLNEFRKNVDLLTYEFENVAIKTLKQINKQIKIYPPISALEISQDRKKEKLFFSKNKIKHAGLFFINKKTNLNKFKDKINFPVILKTCRFGYDGKGQYKVKNFSDLKNKWKKLDYQSCVIEKIIKFDRELSVICSRNIKKNICFYPPFENIHKNHILFETISPSQIDEKINKQLIIISKKILNKLNYIGLLTIEFFLDDENNIYVNEIAPRVHNSGHITLDNANMSQFELHIKAITKDKIKTPKIIKKGLMRNLIGNEIKRTKQISKLKSYKVYKKKKAYDYGKKTIKQGRKMGHINFIK